VHLDHHPVACWGPGTLAVGVEGGNPALVRMVVVDLGKDIALRSRFEDLVVVDCHNNPDGPGDYWSRRLRIDLLADHAGNLHAEEVQMSLCAVVVRSPEARHIEVRLVGTLAVRTLEGAPVAGILDRIAGSIGYYMDQTC